MRKETFAEMKKRHQEEINAFGIGFAFSREQFAEMMHEFGFEENETDKIISIGAGGFIRKTDKAAFIEMLRRQQAEKKEVLQAEKNAVQMFYQALKDHEYSYTRDEEEAVNACGYTMEEIAADPLLSGALNKAISKIRKEEKNLNSKY